MRDKPGGGNEAVDRVELQGHVQVIDLVNNAAADMGALEDPVEVAFGGSSLDAALDVVQEGIEFEKADLGLATFEVLAGPAQFCHQVFAMPEQG